MSNAYGHCSTSVDVYRTLMHDFCFKFEHLKPSGGVILRNLQGQDVFSVSIPLDNFASIAECTKFMQKNSLINAKFIRVLENAPGIFKYIDGEVEVIPNRSYQISYVLETPIAVGPIN